MTRQSASSIDAPPALHPVTLPPVALPSPDGARTEGPRTGLGVGLRGPTRWHDCRATDCPVRRSSTARRLGHSWLLVLPLWCGVVLPVMGRQVSVAFAQPGAASTEQPEKPTPLGPLPATVPTPEGNDTTPTRVELGRLLFFDKRLSGNNTQSCATCHDPQQGWTEAVARTKGSTGEKLPRNTPTVLNSGFLASLFWDGRAQSLEEQALGPLTAPDEMNQDLAELERELAAIAGYRTRFQQAYGTAPTRESIARALAAFQRTLVTGPAPFDRFLAGETDALSEGARRGYELFIGEAGCARCHAGPLLSDGKFHRLGVSFRDVGRGRVTGRVEDRARFRTPSLRNVAQTAPYMHNGSLKTLTDVVTFYYRGIPPVTPDNLPLDIRPRGSQSFSEVTDLVEFLESLTGPPPEIAVPELPE